MDGINIKEFEVYDGRDQILGRLASTIAKRLLQGKKVAIINAEQMIISGSMDDIKARYKVRLDLRDGSNPEHSPYWPRRPDMLVRRIVRGMLPYDKTSGREAYRQLRVFVGVPLALKEAKPVEGKSKSPKTVYSGYVRIAELSKVLGYDKFAQ
jgi:large subunit ribosomal protein L13